MNCPRCGNKLNGCSCDKCGFKLKGDHIRVFAAAADPYKGALEKYIRDIDDKEAAAEAKRKAQARLAAEEAEADRKAADSVTKLINSIGVVSYTDDCLRRISMAESAFDWLTPKQKKLVKKHSALESARLEYEALKSRSKNAVDNVEKLINEIGPVLYTEDCAKRINLAETALGSLTVSQKEQLTNRSVLEAARKKFNRLRQKAEDQRVADAVIKQIAAIGSVVYSDACLKRINDAAAAFDRLTPQQRELVSNRSVLEAAIDRYNDLKKEVKTAADAVIKQIAADVVIKQIAAIGSVVYSDACLERINGAVAAFNLLTPQQRELVSNRSVLEAAIDSYNELKREVKANQSAADAVKKQIAAIGNVVYLDICLERINGARDAFNRLTPQQRELVSNRSVLDAAINRYASLRESAEKKKSRLTGLFLALGLLAQVLILLLTTHIVSSDWWGSAPLLPAVEWLRGAMLLPSVFRVVLLLLVAVSLWYLFVEFSDATESDWADIPVPTAACAFVVEVIALISHFNRWGQLSTAIVPVMCFVILLLTAIQLFVCSRNQRIPEWRSRIFTVLSVIGAVAVVCFGLYAADIRCAFSRGGWGDVDGGRPSYTAAEVVSGKLGDTITFNSVSDSALGDEKNFVGAKVSGAEVETWNADAIYVQDGGTYTIRLLVHNNNPKGSDAAAENVAARFDLPTWKARYQVVDGYLFAENAKPALYWDGVTLYSDKMFYVSYVPGSARYWNRSMGKVSISDEIVNPNSWTALGYDSLNGIIPGGDEYLGVATIDVTVHYSDGI